MEVVLYEKLVDSVFEKEQLFRSLLQHPKVEAIRSRGLMMTLVFDSFETNKKIIDACIANGVITDWFLFAANCLRIAPPLTITEEEIKKACAVIIGCLGEL